MTPPRILVAGIGNIFLGDDAFGVEVAWRLADRAIPEGVRVVDFGIRGFDLAYALLDGPQATILVDAIQRGGAPGTLYVVEPELDETAADGEQAVETHSMHPSAVLHLVRTLGGQPKNVLIVGCEPATFGPDDEGQMGLSDTVQAAVDAAVLLVEDLVADILGGRRGAERASAAVEG